jgi:putative membrane protein
MHILIRWLLSSIIVLVTAMLLPGVHITNFLTALAVSAVLGILNAVLKPVLFILTLPISLITLGLFTLVINGFVIMLTAYIVPGFHVSNFWWAILFSIVVSVINWFVHRIE